MPRINIPVAMMEFDTHGNTLWIHSPKGATVLRIKTMGKINVSQCDSNPVSHSDIITPDDIYICLADDVKAGDEIHLSRGEAQLLAGILRGARNLDEPLSEIVPDIYKKLGGP